MKVAGPLPERVSEEVLQAAIESLLLEINRQMSTWLPESEVSRFNAAPADDWFDVSSATVEVVAEAQRLSNETGGALDVTVGPLVGLWNFGAEGGALGFAAPSDEAITAAREMTGHDKLAVQSEPPALRKDLDALHVDLSAIAKGYAVDQVALLLEDQGIANYLVEIGGEVRTGGSRPGGQPWQIGIERPADQERIVEQTVRLSGVAMATSGDYRNFELIDGKRFSHIIDPATGRPVEHDLASVSVVRPTCMEADGLATALLVMGPQKGYDWAEDHDVAAMFLIRAESGFSARETARWQTLVGPHD